MLNEKPISPFFFRDPILDRGFKVNFLLLPLHFLFGILHTLQSQKSCHNFDFISFDFILFCNAMSGLTME